VKAYLVRLRADQKSAREIVGFFVAPSLDHLAEMVDQCCPVDQSEYRELGRGGIFWEHFTGAPVPRTAEPDWEALPTNWSVVPPDPTLSHSWDDMFRTPDDQAADDALWNPLRWENDGPEDPDKDDGPAVSRGLSVRTPPRRGRRN